MAETDEREVEVVARAICAAHGFDPDETIPDGTVKGVRVPRWLHLRQEARTQIAAFKACRKLYE